MLETILSLARPREPIYITFRVLPYSRMKPIKAIHDSFWNKDDSFRNEAEMFRNIVSTGISRNSGSSTVSIFPH